MQAMRAALALLVLAATTAGCAAHGAASAKPAGARAALVDDRPLIVVGPRCSGAACTCREVDAVGRTLGSTAEGDVPDGIKRFELRTARGPDDVQITVEGRGTLHKDASTIESTCGYVDLPPGEHRVRLRVKAGAGEGGTSPRILVYEHGEKTQSWYGSFGLSCGDASPCTHGELEDRVAALAKAHGLFDPCGSVKVTGVKWDAEKAADERVTSVDLELTLHVYRFTPRFPRGGVCKGPSPE